VGGLGLVIKEARQAIFPSDQETQISEKWQLTFRSEGLSRRGWPVEGMSVSSRSRASTCMAPNF
jgi:hypothetical protein